MKFLPSSAPEHLPTLLLSPRDADHLRLGDPSGLAPLSAQSLRRHFIDIETDPLGRKHGLGVIYLIDEEWRRTNNHQVNYREQTDQEDGLYWFKGGLPEQFIRSAARVLEVGSGGRQGVRLSRIPVERDYYSVHCPDCLARDPWTHGQIWNSSKPRQLLSSAGFTLGAKSPLYAVTWTCQACSMPRDLVRLTDHLFFLKD